MEKMSPEKRSKIMASIGSRDTKPEILLRSLLHREGFRFRVHKKGLPGRPDILLPKFGTIIFVNGCFWHNHGCKFSHIPETRRQFWEEKLGRNKQRDKENTKALAKLGFRVAVVWECTLMGNTEHAMQKLIPWIRNARGEFLEV